MSNSQRLLGLNIWSGHRIDRITTVYTGDAFLSQQYYPDRVFLPVGGTQTFMPVPWGQRIIAVGIGLADQNSTIGFLIFKFQRQDSSIYYKQFGRVGRNGYRWWAPNLGPQGAINGLTARQGDELNYIQFSAHRMFETFPTY